MSSVIRLTGPAIEIALSGPGPWIVGRRSPATPELETVQTVSGEHARLERHPDGRLEITDLNSLNHTYVNGQPIAPDEPVALTTPATISLGRRLELRLVLQS